jgi:hypothetical protein
VIFSHLSLSLSSLRSVFCLCFWCHLQEILAKFSVLKCLPMFTCGVYSSSSHMWDFVRLGSSFPAPYTEWIILSFFLILFFIINFLLGYIHYMGGIWSGNSNQTYIVHLHCPCRLSPSAPSPPHPMQLQEVFSSVSYRFMKSICHIPSLNLLPSPSPHTVPILQSWFSLIFKLTFRGVSQCLPCVGVLHFQSLHCSPFTSPPHPVSQQLSVHIPHPTSRIAHPTSLIPHPSSLIPHPYLHISRCALLLRL